ncbi:HAD-IA family hydrolase [Thermosulfurimonas dismutans]|uniref:2-haloalkanoic acid dehalogenase n=1 Tax=Thermosulfurimonas dismutans TaxID=999894 RepID=A0A179D229_9BACT|nr:HAD-IA family hydrolase [Thermosulfurimonas dismutans]OAQ20125.1 2-haloalkanoic acid dehalogenase [Thermosulfurimonas dismutans]
MFKAIIFDAEGTLFHIRPSVGAIYAEVLRLFGREVPASELEARFRKLWPEIRKELTLFGKEECLEFWRKAFFETVSPWLDGLPEDETFRRAYEYFASPKAFVPAKGFPEVLSLLKKSGVKTAILSNWDERLHRLLSALGLKQAFDAIFTACELGVGKPDPEAFHLACEALGVRPEEALMIGNDPKEDYEGALRAGLQALLYRGEDLRTLLKKFLPEVQDGTL